MSGWYYGFTDRNQAYKEGYEEARAEVARQVRDWVNENADLDHLVVDVSGIKRFLALLEDAAPRQPEPERMPTALDIVEVVHEKQP